MQIFRKSINPPRWPGNKVGHQYAPPDVPLCGFRGEFCESEEGIPKQLRQSSVIMTVHFSVAGWIIAVAAVLAVLAMAVAIGLGIYLYR
jgi:atrial natriuretic peptide receptor A/atrial natriuretic peptide receptor B